MSINLRQLEPEELEILIANGENQYVSLQEAVPPPGQLARELGALANGGGGNLILGMRPDGSVPGVTPFSVMAGLDRAAVFLEPNPVTTLSVAERNGKTIAVIEVQSAETPISATGAVLIRQGARIRPADQARILDLAISRVDGATVTGEEALQQLTRQIEAQTIVIEQLRREAELAGSWQFQLKGWLYGGLIGAVIGIALGYVF